MSQIMRKLLEIACLGLVALIISSASHARGPEASLTGFTYSTPHISRIAESMELHKEISLTYELMTRRTLASATIPPKQFWDCQRTPMIQLGSHCKETLPMGRKTMLLSMTTIFSFNWVWKPSVLHLYEPIIYMPTPAFVKFHHFHSYESPI